MAVTFLNTNTVGHAIASPVSAAMTVSTGGKNVGAFVRIAYNSAAGMSVTTVTYGGQTMTSVGAAAHNATSQCYVEWYYLVNPPTGSNTLSITVAGTVTDIYYNLTAFSGVNQTTPVRAGTYQATTGSSTSPSQTITSNASDLSISAIDSGGPAISSTNQTSDGIDTSGAFAGASDHATTAAATVTHTWTLGASGQWAMAGFSVQTDGLTFAALTFFANNPVQSGSNAGLLATSAPAASTSTTGWTVGTTAINNYSRQTYNTEKAATTFAATVEPSGAPLGTGQDCWRLSAATTGDFSAGTWYSSISVIAVTSSSAQRGAALFRLWRSANFDGTSATEITKSRMTGGTLASTLLTTVAQSSSASTQVAAFSLSNEYLFWQVGWQITTLGTNANADVLIRLGNMGTTGSGSGLVTSIFSSTAGGGGGAVPNGAYYYSMMADWFNK